MNPFDDLTQRVGDWHRLGTTVILDDPFAVDPGQTEISGEVSKVPPGGREQSRLLASFFGSGAAGARKRMADFWVPPGLTRTSLLWYRDVVVPGVFADPRKATPQARLVHTLRLRLIGRALRAGGLDPEAQAQRAIILGDPFADELVATDPAEAAHAGFSAMYEVIPPDERELVRRTLDPPFRWICSLHAHFKKPWPKGMKTGLARGTGLLVGPRHVLTAAHCIYPDGQTSPTSLYVAPARNGRTDPLGRCKAVAFNVPTPAFGRHGIDQRHDYAIITLECEIAHQRYSALGGATLGHWGCTEFGQGTVLRALGRDFLQGKRVNVCGYPGDRCGIEPIDTGSSCDPPGSERPSPDCSIKDQATTQWIDNGILSWRTAHDPLFLHTADTSRGQSGSPVWMRFASGRRYLVGVHVDAECRSQDINGKRTLLPVRGNLAVHLDDQVLAMIRSWMS